MKPSLDENFQRRQEQKRDKKNKNKKEVSVPRKTQEGLGGKKGKKKKGKNYPVKHLLFVKKSNSKQRAPEVLLWQSTMCS